jgi:lysophospholipid acyltransferase (LPLAT)-like uncharacterized protein
MGIRYDACWRMRSWDRFAMPIPFSKVEVTLVREPMPADGEADEVIAARLKASLDETSTDPA